MPLLFWGGNSTIMSLQGLEKDRDIIELYHYSHKKHSPFSRVTICMQIQIPFTFNLPSASLSSYLCFHGVTSFSLSSSSVLHIYPESLIHTAWRFQVCQDSIISVSLWLSRMIRFFIKRIWSTLAMEGYEGLIPGSWIMMRHVLCILLLEYSTTSKRL